jgi:hypothetical protein
MGSELFYQFDDLGMTVIERCEPESHEVGRAEISNDPPGRHLLDKTLAARKPKRHMASAVFSFPR